MTKSYSFSTPPSYYRRAIGQGGAVMHKVWIEATLDGGRRWIDVPEFAL
jgi:hypothetical protein